jgi:hypothetical protein
VAAKRRRCDGRGGCGNGDGGRATESRYGHAGRPSIGYIAGGIGRMPKLIWLTADVTRAGNSRPAAQQPCARGRRTGSVTDERTSMENDYESDVP